MMRMDIIASGTLKDTDTLNIINNYVKRLHGGLDIREISINHNKKTDSSVIKQKERDEFLKHIDKTAYIIALDEHGKNLSSIELSDHIQKIQDQSGHHKIQFLIGGAFGFHRDILEFAHMKLCFGKLTWPHMMVRMMLVEQIYRVQQIQSGHPYHKE